MQIEQLDMPRLIGLREERLPGSGRSWTALALMLVFSACDPSGSRELNQPGRASPEAPEIAPPERSGEVDCRLLSPVQCQAQKIRRKLESRHDS